MRGIVVSAISPSTLASWGTSRKARTLQSLFGGDPLDEVVLILVRIVPALCDRSIPVVRGDSHVGDEILSVVLGEEADACGVAARLRKFDAVSTEHLGEIVVGYLQGDPGTIPCAFIGADAASVFEFAQCGQSLFDDLMVCRATVADDERQPTCVVLECRIVESGTNWLTRSFRGR